MFDTKNNTTPKAHIISEDLTLYLPNAIKPCVWRMNIKKLSETSIEIDERDGVYVLISRDLDGVTKAISGFQNRDDALNVLSLILGALMDKKSVQATNSYASFFKNILKFLKWIVIILIVIWLGFFILKIFEGPVVTIPEFTQTQQERVTDPSGNLELGVPIDVDELFQNQENE